MKKVSDGDLKLIAERSLRIGPREAQSMAQELELSRKVVEIARLGLKENSHDVYLGMKEALSDLDKMEEE